MSESNASATTSTAELRRSLIEDLLITHLQQQSDADIDDAEIVAQHPDLMPELGEQLQLLREIADQRIANHAMDTAAANGEASTIRCPHCRERILVSTMESLSDITCRGCGSCFSLAEDMSKDALAAQVKKVDQFELVEKIGFGSFGIVWKARDTELERWVAIKIPRRGKLSLREVEQFKREARAAARLSHPNIVSVYGVGRDESLCIVSDLVEGVSLSEQLAEQPLTIEESCELCVTVAEALQHAHDAGVIHRDLKPQNIMLDADGNPHLLDFGLARQSASEITMTLDGHVLGTPVHAARTGSRRSEPSRSPGRHLFVGRDLVPTADW